MRSSVRICFILLVLAPALLSAGEGVDVSFSVQAIHIQDTIAARLGSKAQWVFVAEDVASGKTVVDVGNSRDTSLVPGSLVKLFVTAAVLERNSKEPFDLVTVIATDGKINKGTLRGDLVIKGAGNAFLSAPDLQGVAEKLKARGIAEITGDIIVDDSLFDVKGWKNRYHGPAYGAPSALGLDLHTVSIMAEGSKSKYIIDPPNESIKVSFNPAGKPGIRQIDDVTYEITGAVPDAPVVRSRFSLTDPSLYAGGVLMTLLKNQGIVISGKVKRGILQTGAKEIVLIESRDINTYIRDTNRQSLNVAADNLVFLMGANAYGTPGTQKKGLQAIHDFLSNLGVPTDGMVLADGSGVSEGNRISAEQMVTFLQAISKKQWFNAFFESLTMPGRDGRLQDFGYRSDRIHAKSGQVPDVYSLAGYIDRQDSGKIAFAFMVNGSNLDRPAAKSAAIEVLQHLEGK